MHAVRDSALGTSALVVTPVTLPPATVVTSREPQGRRTSIGDFAVTMHDRFHAVTALRGNLEDSQRASLRGRWVGGGALVAGGLAAAATLVAGVSALVAGVPMKLGISEPLMVSAIVGVMAAMAGSVLGGIGLGIARAVNTGRPLKPGQLDFASRAAAEATPLQRAVLAELAQRWGETLAKRSIEGRAAAEVVYELAVDDSTDETRATARGIVALLGLIYEPHTGLLNVRSTYRCHEIVDAFVALPPEVCVELAPRLLKVFFRDREGDSSPFLFHDVRWKHYLFHMLSSAAANGEPSALLAPASEPT